jgi:hypothetical protein
MQWLILGAVGLGLVGLIVFAVLKSGKKDWRGLAQQMGLAERGGVMVGRIDRFMVTIGLRQARDTRLQGRMDFRIDFPAVLGLGLSVTARPAGERSMRTLNTGDETFDAKVAIVAQDPNKTMQYLTPERRARLLEFIASDSRAVVNDQGLIWYKDGGIDKPAEFKQIIETLLATSEDLFSG